MICYDLNLSACVSPINPAEGSCDDEFCSAHIERQDVAPEREPKTMGESSEWLDSKAPKEDWTGVDEGEDGQPIRDIKEKVTVDGKSVGGMPYPSIPKFKRILKIFQRY